MFDRIILLLADPAWAVLAYLVGALLVLLPYARLRKLVLARIERALSRSPKLKGVLLGIIHIPMTVLPIILFFPLFPLVVYLFREGEAEPAIVEWNRLGSQPGLDMAKKRSRKKDKNRPIGGNKVVEGILLDLDPNEDRAAIKIARMLRNRIVD
ncbi:MAG: hypothetical protein ACK4FJ_16940 [Ferrovibrio sp.]|uniref:hypothetical protein n=1 Tax=Ferrovibrio sp. TaxID=1917215 RepID=UPI00391CEB37